jgi:ABC-2 type transport system ATP-binding protein
MSGRAPVRSSPAAAAPAAIEPVLEIRGLHKVYRGHLGIGRSVAVDGLDLSIRRGEIFGLLGPNGAGKTTTLKILLGLLRADRGEVRLFGLPPADPRARARVGYLPENPYFYDHLTAAEFLDFYGRLRGIPAAERRERVLRTLARVGLADRADTALRKLSKGMTQRLGLAQAIQHEPELVILDEPMSGLDPIGRREVRDCILELRQSGRTVFFSSHILQDAEMICDRVAILDRGRLSAEGALRDLVSRTVRWFEVEIAGPLPAGVPCDRVSSQGETHLVQVADAARLARLIDAVHHGGGQVLSVWPRRDTLEDLFLRELGRDRGGAGR